MRLVTGAALIGNAISILRAGASIESLIAHVLAIGAGILLIAGLWTPVSGMLVAAFEVWNALSQPQDPWAKVLLGTLGMGLALLGPGAWSVDARLFGWKRIHIKDRNEPDTQTSRQKSR